MDFSTQLTPLSPETVFHDHRRRGFIPRWPINAGSPEGGDQAVREKKSRRSNSKKTKSSRREQDSDGAPRIGIVIGQYGSSYYGRMLDGAGEWLARNGYDTIVQASNVTMYGERRAWNSLNQCQCEGIILHSDLLSDGQLSSMLEKNPRSVLMNRLVPGFEAQCVYVDNEKGGQIAADYLAGLGHRKMAMICGPRQFKESGARSKGFLHRLAQRGLSVPPRLIYEGSFLHECGREGMKKLLDTELLFTAVFAHNDAMAAGVLDACSQLGISVPGQISVIGYDDLECARIVTPKLTTIRQPKMLIGTRSAQILHDLIVEPDKEDRLPPDYGIIFPKLIVRESVKNLTDTGNLDMPNHELLTTRETECLQLIAAGRTSGNISSMLCISESTVNFHLKNILEKLHANNRTHAVAIALSRSLIKPL